MRKKCLLSAVVALSATFLLFPKMLYAADPTSLTNFELTGDSGEGSIEFSASDIMFSPKQMEKQGTSTTLQNNVLKITVDNYSGYAKDWKIKASLSEFIGVKTKRKLMGAKLTFDSTDISPISEFEPAVIDSIRPSSKSAVLTPSPKENPSQELLIHSPQNKGYGKWQATYGTKENSKIPTTTPIKLSYYSGNTADKYVATLTYSLEVGPVV
ncbi:WxL domain-containing protein [Vagococcus silagei]|nr:WxL domain-containing protein [Vagococcus silagei]